MKRNALPSIKAALTTALRTRAECTVEIGRLLLQAKGLVEHGEWLPWLKSNFPLSDRTAERYMAVAKWVDARGLKIDIVSNLEPAVLNEMVHYEAWEEDEIQAILAEAAGRPVSQDRAYEISEAVLDARPEPAPDDDDTDEDDAEQIEVDTESILDGPPPLLPRPLPTPELRLQCDTPDVDLKDFQEALET